MNWDLYVISMIHVPCSYLRSICMVLGWLLRIVMHAYMVVIFVSNQFKPWTAGMLRYLLSTVVTDAFVLNPQDINIHSSDLICIVLDPLHTEILFSLNWINYIFKISNYDVTIKIGQQSNDVFMSRVNSSPVFLWQVELPHGSANEAILKAPSIINLIVI